MGFKPRVKSPAVVAAVATRLERVIEAHEKRKHNAAEAASDHQDLPDWAGDGDAK